MQVILLAIVCVGGCGERAPDPLYAVRVELTALRQELLLLREQTEEIEPRVSAAESIALQIIDERLAPVLLDCSGRRAATLATPIASISVTCEQFQRSTDGYRLRIRAGNPTAGRLEQVGFTVYAGPGASRGRSELRYFEESPVPIPPGSSRPVVIELPGLQPHEATEVALSARIGRVALVQR